jgi:hypothetical protein
MTDKIKTAAAEAVEAFKQAFEYLDNPAAQSFAENLLSELAQVECWSEADRLDYFGDLPEYAEPPLYNSDLLEAWDMEEPDDDCSDGTTWGRIKWRVYEQYRGELESRNDNWLELLETLQELAAAARPFDAVESAQRLVFAAHGGADEYAAALEAEQEALREAQPLTPAEVLELAGVQK